MPPEALIPAPPVLPRTRLRPTDRDPALREARIVLESAARKTRLWTVFRRGQATEAQRRAILDQVRTDAMKRSRSLAAPLIRGERTADAWLRSMRDALPARHYAASLAINGSLILSDHDRRDVEASVRVQFGYLVRRAELIRSGKPLNLGIADLYGAAVWTTAEGLRASQALRKGFTEERAHRAALDSCLTCLDRTGGERVGLWVPIGTLRSIGQGECLSRCRCWLEYRKTG